MSQLLWRALVLLAGGAVLGFGANAVREDGVSVSSFSAPATCGAPGDGLLEVDRAAVRLVSQAEASALCADSATLIADARSAEAFAQGHVTGAMHLPCSASEQVARAAETGLSDKRLLLVYGESTDDAFPVAEQMRKRLDGPLEIGVLEGGFSAWTAAGLACSSGMCPECGAEEHGGHRP